MLKYIRQSTGTVTILYADPKLSTEDKEIIAARIADLYVDIRSTYQSEYHAKRQRRNANSETAKELENVSLLHSKVN